MTNTYFKEESLDDVMRVSLQALLKDGHPVKATKGPNTELIGVTLEITNPRARISRTESRGKPFSCLGELLWYLSACDDLAPIEYYIPRYALDADDGKLRGAYGKRMFDWAGSNQFANIAELLRRKSSSRQAVVQLFDRHDIAQPQKDVPCTCTLQFLNRKDALHLVVTMRSNDVYLGFPHDVFCFTMLQEIMAVQLGLELGTYKHFAASFHLYDERVDRVKEFLSEGWQQTDLLMPPMPKGDPWPALTALIAAERAIRTGGETTIGSAQRLDAYWEDLVRLLRIFRCTRDGQQDKLVELSNGFHSACFRSFVDRRAS